MLPQWKYCEPLSYISSTTVAIQAIRRCTIKTAESENPIMSKRYSDSQGINEPEEMMAPAKSAEGRNAIKRGV